jgi:ABC-type dipeptide/oligopeptide/nickel transport system permease component
VTLSNSSQRWSIGLLRHLFLFLGLLTLTFLLFSVIPVDPARAMLGMNADEAAVQALRHDLGLDRALWRQFLHYCTGLLRLDFGISFVTRRPVTMDLFAACVATLRYVLIALLLSQLTSLGVAYIAFFHHRFAVLAWRTANVVTSLPGLIWALGLGLALLGGNVLIAIASLEQRYILTAGLALSVYPCAALTQILISECQRIRQLKYVTAGRSFGFTERELFFKHVLANALLPWLTQFSNIAASLLAGSIFIEIIFSIPGLGHLVVQSVLQRDFPMIQAVLSVCFFCFILLNLFVEKLYRVLAPQSWPDELCVNE